MTGTGVGCADDEEFEGESGSDGCPTGVGGPGAQTHPAYRRLAGGGPPPRSVRPPAEPVRTRVTRTAVCPRCDAPESCCHCAADVAEVRRFATRMAMIHQSTGTAVCGCGTHNCYVRTRLDAIWHRFWR